VVTAVIGQKEKGRPAKGYKYGSESEDFTVVD
jgi:hypothetical protein